MIDKIKNTWDDVSDTVHGSHFLTPNGEIIGNYNHNTMVTDLAPMIDDFELTGKVTRGGGRLKNMETGEWYDEEKTIEPVANWNDITNFLTHTGFVRATNEGKSESGYGHTINLTVNGTLTSSQIRAIQRMEQTSAGGTTLNFDIMGDETQSGHGTFRDFMKAYRKNYGTEAFVEDEHPRDGDGKFADKGGGEPIKSVPIKDFNGKWIKYGKKDGFYSGFIQDTLKGVSSLEWKDRMGMEDNELRKLGVGVVNYGDLDEWEKLKTKFMESLEKTPELKKRFDEYKKEVDQQNKQLQEKFKNSKGFYRGTTLDELNSMIEKEHVGVDTGRHNPDLYDFKSLSMNETEVNTMYNAGVVIEYGGDDVREKGKLLNYSAEPTPYLHWEAEHEIFGDVESVSDDYPAFLLDEEEVRVDNMHVYDMKAENIKISLSFGFHDMVKQLSNMFEIPDYVKELREFQEDLYSKEKDTDVRMKKHDEKTKEIAKKIENDLNNSKIFKSISRNVEVRP